MRRYGRYDVTLPDEKYVWEPDEVSLGEQLMIETEFGDSYTKWIAAVGVDEQAIACQILIWFLRRKDGKQEDRMAVEFPIRHLDIVQTAEVEVDEDPEASAGSEPAT